MLFRGERGEVSWQRRLPWGGSEAPAVLREQMPVPSALPGLCRALGMDFGDSRGHTARPASLNSLPFPGLLMDGLQKHLLASAARPAHPKSDKADPSRGQRGSAAACPWLWFVPSCGLSLAAPGSADRALLLCKKGICRGWAGPRAAQGSELC